MHEAGSRWCRLRRVVALLQHREHFRQPVVDYINPDCLVSKCIEKRMETLRNVLILNRSMLAVF